MKTKKDEIYSQIELEYYRIAAGYIIDIMDIPKVFRDSKKAIDSGATVSQAVRAAVLMYCSEVMK